MALRIKFDPAEDSSSEGILVDVGRVSFTQFGEGDGFATQNPLPAKLSFSCRLFESGRADAAFEESPLNVLKGTLRLEAGAADGTASVVFECDPESFDEWAEQYDKALDAREEPFLVRPREIALDLVPEHFSGLEPLQGTQLRLALPKLAEGKRYAEIAVALEIDGQPEAPAASNDVLDVPLLRVSLVDVRLFLFDSEGARLPGVPFRLTLDDTIRSGESDSAGVVEQSEIPDSSVFLLEWGKPEEGAPQGSFAFCRYVHLLDAPTGDQSTLLRLDNLGYVVGTKAERLSEFAGDYPEDVADEGGKEPALLAVHDEGRPTRA